MTSTTKVTLLFAHGGGFCKETWDPIIRRLRESPSVQGVDTDFVTFDFPNHGEKCDPTVVDLFKVDVSNPKAPRVWNEKHDLIRETVIAVQEQVALWKDKTKSDESKGQLQHKLIGIGHSMGAEGLWAAEVAHPGTFDGLILFEPVLVQKSPENDFLVDFLVGLTLKREMSWPSRAAAEDFFYDLKNFAKWDRETLAGYLRGGLVEKEDGSITLACHPKIEAWLYCQPPLWLTDDELQRPKCRTTFHWGSRSKLWFGDHFKAIQSKLPHLYEVREPMEGNSHVLVLENPSLSAERIVHDLIDLKFYAAA